MRKEGKTATGEYLWGGASDRPTATGNDLAPTVKFPCEACR
jgi:hypothetical protein